MIEALTNELVLQWGMAGAFIVYLIRQNKVLTDALQSLKEAINHDADATARLEHAFREHTIWAQANANNLRQSVQTSK